MQVIAGGKLSHHCANCGTWFEWTESSRWFGSYAQMDAGEPLIKFCTVECAAEERKRLKLRASDGTTPESPEKDEI